MGLVMARNIFGYKKVPRDKYQKHKYDETDIRWLYVKFTIFLISTVLFFWFIILGKTL
tara:strand:- start:1519 stop:1692 length:174 start_codon:yes stop_codon:yes gene_type:complete